MGQEVAGTQTTRKRRPIKPPDGQYISERAGAVNGLHGAISPTEEPGSLRTAPEATHRSSCGDLTELNTSRAILDSVGKRMLKRIAGSAIDLLGTSVAIYERNGDYALGIFSSAWCRLLDRASRRLCNTRDNKKALDCGKWHCHESCWHDAAKVAIDTGRCVDVECRGGIRLYALPILAGEEVVGAFSVGYGDPPSDGRTLASLARRYRVKVEELRRKAGTCQPRPPAVIEAAKRMLLTSAELIGKIVELEQAEKSLRESEQQAMALMNATTDTALLVDRAGRTIAINEAGARRFGKTPDQIVGVCIFDLMPPDVAERRKAVMEEVIRTGRAMRFRDEREGAIFDNAALPICDPEGKVRQFTVFARDVTQRVRATEALRQSEERFRLIAEKIHDVLWMSAPGVTKIIYVSPAYEEIWGRSCQSLYESPRSFMDTVHPEDRELVEAELERHAKGQYGPIEYRIVQPDGAIRWIEDRGFPIRDKDGKLLYLTGIATDITNYKTAEQGLLESKADLEARVRQRTYDLTRTVEELEGEVRDRIRAELALKKSEEKYRALAENTLDIIYSLDRNGNLNYVSPQVERYGFDAQQLISQSILKLVYEDDRRRVESMFQRAIFSKQTHVTEFRVKGKDGDLHWFEDRGTVQFDNSGDACGIIGVLRDVTEKMAAEEAIRESDKLAATGRMAARIAHEINNPLAGIKNSFLLIKDGIPADHPYNSYVSRIENEIERISRIVRQMFNVYRPGTEGPSEFVVEEVLADLVALLEPECRLRGVTIITQMPRIPTTVLLKKDSVVQILFNIIQNAIEASPRMGSVKVTVKPSGDSLLIRVRDQGKGIPKSVRSQVFEPFFTTKAAGPGSKGGLGLGLSASRSLAVSMGGVVDFTSRSGHGTTFRIVLPLRQEQRNEGDLSDGRVEQDSDC